VTVTKRFELAPEIAMLALEVPEVPLRNSVALAIESEREETVTLLANKMLWDVDAMIEALVVEIVIELEAPWNAMFEPPVDVIVQLVTVIRSAVTDDAN
jgi:hypothetical protein